jgi:hypothetical protein
LEEEALDLTMWRNCFIRCYVNVVNQSAEWMKQTYIPVTSTGCVLWPHISTSG